MYCKHCGNEIADDSKFCQHCGGKQTEESVRSSRWKDFIASHKKLSYSYLIWLSINLIALVCGMANPHRLDTFHPFRRGEIDTGGFFPFAKGGIGNYDFSEFVVYTVAIPLFLYAIIKLVKSFKRSR